MSVAEILKRLRHILDLLRRGKVVGAALDLADLIRTLEA